MNQFDTTFALLTERLLIEDIQKTDIIDLYVIMAMPPLSDQAQSFIAQQVVKETSTRILEEAETAVLREVRHVDVANSLTKLYNFGRQLKAYTRNHPKATDMDVKRFFDNDMFRAGKKIGLPPFSMQTRGTWETFSNAFSRAYSWTTKMANKQKIMTIEELNKYCNYTFSFSLIAKIFNAGDWEIGYGGYEWAKIALAVDSLKSSSNAQFAYNLDRLVDLVHNTGSVLNKFRTYKQGWLTYLLDLKQHAINLNELIPYASSEVRKLFTSPEWRTFKSSMPGGNETAGIERIISKTLLSWHKDIVSGKRVCFGDIVNLILHTKYNLIEGFQNLYNHSTPEEKIKYSKTIIKMIRSVVYSNGPKMFRNPTRKNIISFATDGKFEFMDDDRNDYDKHIPQKNLIRYTQLLLGFLTSASQVVGFDLNAFLIKEEKTSEWDDEHGYIGPKRLK